MTYFIDFDYTIFDAAAFTRYLQESPKGENYSGLSPREVAAALEPQVKDGSFAFAPGELAPFVYVDVPEFLRDVGNSAIVITYGNPFSQRAKVQSALHGIPRVTALYTGDERKGRFLAERIDAYGTAPVVVDDLSEELEILAELCPQARLFEMRRDKARGDGRWPVIGSLSELP